MECIEQHEGNEKDKRKELGALAAPGNDAPNEY
jgi:hypothetical protein